MNVFSALFVSALLVASTIATTSTTAESKSTTVTEKSVSKDDIDGVDSVASRQNSRCYSTQFQCTSGQCISKNLLCNGRNDCRDGSDESYAICYNNRPTARPTTTTSRYPGFPLQNQGEESNNNNDDNQNNNNNNNQNKPQSSFSCESGQFECTSGECISRDRICDGNNDCYDGSDEGTSICPNNGGNADEECLSSEFRCNSGQCIFAGYRCDGQAQCDDGSDEDYRMCQEVSAERPTPTTRRPHVTQNPGGNESWQQKLRPCSVPAQPTNGRWRLHRSLCDSGRECNAPSNVRSMDPGSYLVYNCDEGFNLKGNRDVLCGPNGHWITEPTCEEVRCGDLSSSTTEALCMWNNVAVSCEVPAPVGTTGQLQCRKGFVQEVAYTQAYKNVTCGSDGKWTPKPISCVKTPKKVKLVLVGDMTILDN